MQISSRTIIYNYHYQSNKLNASGITAKTSTEIVTHSRIYTYFGPKTLPIGNKDVYIYIKL